MPQLLKYIVDIWAHKNNHDPNNLGECYRDRLGQTKHCPASGLTATWFLISLHLIAQGTSVF